MKSVLNIFSAGVARKVVSDTIAKYNKLYPNITINLTVDGSVDLIRRSIAGESCDVLILADDKIIDTMMIPDKTDGYIVFAGNRMVIAANEGYTISSGNWQQKLLEPDATFDHHNPHADPGGYRAVMSMMLADAVEPGLSEKLLNHPGHFGMGNDPANIPEIKYCFDYYTRAASRKAPIAELPETMNLSRDDLADVYAQAEFQVDSDTTVKATPICHAVTIPFSADNPDDAKKFVELFLKNDFTEYGFIRRKAVIGNNIIE